MTTRRPHNPLAMMGYRWPAEWATHEATWLAWPHNPNTWPGVFPKIAGRFAQLAIAIARCEPVRILAGRGEVLRQAESLVGGRPNITLYQIETNDAWIRDFGPTFLQPPAGMPAAVVDWRYNAWGVKYPPFELDNAAAAEIARCTGHSIFTSDLVLEGGAIDGNGAGLLMSTQSCLLSESRNPKHSQHTIEGVLTGYLGADEVLWLPRGELAGDDTDGHIDQLARFVDSHTVVAAVAWDREDENFAALDENARFLEQFRDASGRSLDVIRLPAPPPIRHQGRRLPASYCNFYLVNGGVFVPQFGDARADEQARDTLRQLFPDRRVELFPVEELLVGLGAIHCLTMQQGEGC